MPSPASEPATGTATVTVACKLPHGLICRIHKKDKRMVPVYGGGYKEEEFWSETGEEFILNGNAYPQNEAPKVPLAHGFALTYGVRKDWWDAWIMQNRLLPAVKNGLIFAHERQGKTEDEAKEKAGVKSGLERLDPKNLPPEFRKIEMAAESAKPVPAAA